MQPQYKIKCETQGISGSSVVVVFWGAGGYDHYLHQSPEPEMLSGLEAIWLEWEPWTTQPVDVGSVQVGAEAYPACRYGFSPWTRSPASITG